MGDISLGVEDSAKLYAIREHFVIDLMWEASQRPSFDAFDVQIKCCTRRSNVWMLTKASVSLVNLCSEILRNKGPSVFAVVINHIISVLNCVTMWDDRLARQVKTLRVRGPEVAQSKLA